MRSYKAARRSAERRPVPFLYNYDEEAEVSGADGGTTVVTTEKRVLFECRGEVSTLLLSELAYNADLDVADPSAMKLIRSFFAQAFGVRSHTLRDEEGEPILDDKGEEQQVVVHDEAWRQYNKFFNLHTEHGDDDLLMEIMGGLVEDFSARPTKSPSTLQPGAETTGVTSKVVSLSRGTVVEGSVEDSEESGARSSG